MPAGTQSAAPLEVLLTRLHEVHDLSVYEAIERLVQASEEAGLDSSALVRMLERGMTFEKLLELVKSKADRPQKAA